MEEHCIHKGQKKLGDLDVSQILPPFRDEKQLQDSHIYKKTISWLRTDLITTWSDSHSFKKAEKTYIYEIWIPLLWQNILELWDNNLLIMTQEFAEALQDSELLFSLIGWLVFMLFSNKTLARMSLCVMHRGIGVRQR